MCAKINIDNKLQTAALPLLPVNQPWKNATEELSWILELSLPFRLFHLFHLYLTTAAKYQEEEREKLLKV
jgi:hypothetical protein